MKNARLAVLIVLGLAFLGLAVYYWITPANALPQFFPGYEAGSTATHLKHGLAALLLALGCGVLAWFSSAKSETPAAPSEPEE